MIVPSHDYTLPHSSVSVDREKKQIEMTFRSGDARKEVRPSVTLADLTEGQKVEGRVKKIEEYGLFIEIGLKRN